MLVLDFQHVPSWFHCFLWHRRAYGKNGQILHFWTFQTKLYLSFSSGRDTSWQADRFQNVATVQLFSVTGTILWTCPSWFGVACAALQACVVACFMWIAFSRLRRVMTTCRLSGTRGISWECPFAWQAQYLVQIRLVWSAMCGKGNIGTLYILHFALVTPHFTLNDTLRITVRYNFHTLHLTLHTLKLYTPHFTFYTLHITIPTSYPAHYIPHSTPHCLHTPHSALNPVPHSTIYSGQGKTYKTVETFFSKNCLGSLLVFVDYPVIWFPCTFFFAMMCSGLTPPNQRLFPTSLCGVLVFGCVLPAAPPLFPRNSLTHSVLTHNSHPTHTHTHTSHTHTHIHNSYTQLTHTQGIHTHPQLTHTQLAHTQLTHTHNSYTYNLHKTHTHTTYSHTTRTLSYTHTHNLLTHNSHTTHTHNLVTHNSHTHNSFTHNSLTHKPSLCVAGVALGDIDVQSAWQAWHLNTYTYRHTSNSLTRTSFIRNYLSPSHVSFLPFPFRLHFFSCVPSDLSVFASSGILRWMCVSKIVKWLSYVYLHVLTIPVAAQGPLFKYSWWVCICGWCQSDRTFSHRRPRIAVVVSPFAVALVMLVGPLASQAS